LAPEVVSIYILKSEKIAFLFATACYAQTLFMGLKNAPTILLKTVVIAISAILRNERQSAVLQFLVFFLLNFITFTVGI